MRPPSRLRLLLLGLGGIGLLAGLTGALVLLGVPMPRITATVPGSHGVLMTLGFLGTLIALERAVALGRGWASLAPLASGLGGIGLVAGLGWVAHGLLVIGAAVFVAMYVAFDRIERSLHGSIQALGALAWLGAALLLLAGWSLREAYPWLAAFLVLTIAGERLELSRLVVRSQRVRWAFVACALLFGGGVGITLVELDAGIRVGGIGLVALAIWLGRYDLARRTVRLSGVTRFVAISLLAGYAWMAVAGVAWIVFGASPPAAAYDAMLHALFLGFVVSMVFGHAPIILPAVLRTPLPYRPRFYAHLALLHVGLILRVGAGDLLGLRALWVAGGVIGVVSLLVFVVSSAGAVIGAPRTVSAADRSITVHPSSAPRAD